MKRLRKALTITVMMVTVLSMSMVAVPLQANAAAQAGDLIKMSGLSSVYYLGGDGKRYVFPNEQTYFSWYSDFSSVVTIPQSELESYSLGANVTIRPGTKLVKITTDPKVYAVESDGTLKHVSTEATAIALYGANWAKRVVDVPDAFFTNYTVSTGTVSATAYPEGSLIKQADSADVYYVASDGKARKIASEAAFTANRFKWSDIITTTLAIPTVGTEVAAAESTLIDTSSGAGGTAGAGTGLTVSLSGITAPSSTLVATQAIANLASFNLTASNDGAVKVTGVQLKRLGISGDTTLSAIYLYEGTTRITDSATVSSSYINWTNSAGIITVPAGTTKTITVKSNILTGTSGQTVGVGVEAAVGITTDGAAVSGSFPINGNLHSIATATLASASFGTVTPSTNTSLAPQDDFALWNSAVTVGERAVDMEYLTLRQIGSVLTDDLQNFELYIDGAKVGDTVARMDSNGYITFALATKKNLTAATHTFKVMVDIVGGSSRTTSLSLQRTSDASFIDSEYNVPILITAAAATFSAQSSGTQTISSGSLTITKKTTSATGNVVKGASNVSLASYEFKASGESIKVESLKANVIVSRAAIDGLRNGKIYANGVQIGSTANLAAADGTSAYYTEYTLGSSLVVKPGTPVTVEIKADIFDKSAGDSTDSTTAGDTIQAQIASSTNNAQRMTSLTYFSTPASDTAANSLTIQTGSVTCSKSSTYLNHTTVVPQTAYKIAEFVCTANTTEDINLTTLALGLNNTAGFTLTAGSMFSDVYLVYGADTTVTKSTVATSSFSVSGTTITDGNEWTINKTLAKNGSITIAAYSNLASNSGTGTINGDLAVAYTTVGSATAGLTDEADGQTVTVSTASLASAATEDPLDQVTFGNQTVTAANYEITATSDIYKIEEIAIKFLDASAIPAIGKVYLYDGSTLLKADGQVVDVNGYATTTGLTLEVPANGTKKITVKLALNSVGTGAATPGLNASTTLDTVVARNSQGTLTNVADDRQGNQLFVYKAYPVITHVVTSNRTVTNNASQEVYKFTVTPSSGGTVGLKQFNLGLSWTNEGPVVAALELESVKLYRGTTDITTLVTIVDNAGADVEDATGALEANTSMYFAWNEGTEEQISAATTYVVKATPVNFDSGTTSSDQVAITFSGDTSAHNGTNRYVGDNNGNSIFGLGATATANGTDYNFIWSDRSSVGHSATSGSSTADWANGYKLDYLPLDSTVMKK